MISETISDNSNTFSKEEEKELELELSQLIKSETANEILDINLPAAPSNEIMKPSTDHPEIKIETNKLS